MTSQRVTLTLSNYDNVIQYKDEAYNRLIQMDIASRFIHYHLASCKIFQYLVNNPTVMEHLDATLVLAKQVRLQAQHDPVMSKVP